MNVINQEGLEASIIQPKWGIHYRTECLARSVLLRQMRAHPCYKGSLVQISTNRK